MRLEDLKTGLRLSDVVLGETVVVIAANGYGADAVELTFKVASGGAQQQGVASLDQSADHAEVVGHRRHPPAPPTSAARSAT